MEANISGAEIINRLRKGHMVRRACWVDELFIRICNEAGFDDDGNAIVPERHPMYTHSTRGYFLHFAYSSQPMRKPRVFNHGGFWELAAREGEGIAMMFADDWEDWGFVTDEAFELFTKAKKKLVQENWDEVIRQAIKLAEENYDKGNKV